jgi:hypothetical protein
MTPSPTASPARASRLSRARSSRSTRPSCVTPSSCLTPPRCSCSSVGPSTCGRPRASAAQLAPSTRALHPQQYTIFGTVTCAFVNQCAGVYTQVVHRKPTTSPAAVGRRLPCGDLLRGHRLQCVGLEPSAAAPGLHLRRAPPPHVVFGSCSAHGSGRHGGRAF